MIEIRRISRRGFLQGLFSTGALILGAGYLPDRADDAGAGEQSWQPSIYLGIEPDGTVRIVAHRSEMGTGIRTALPMVAADELEADWSRVRVEQALGDPKYGDQNTDGSRSIRDFFLPLRQAGATARLMLERAAAAQWQVPVTECRATNHQVVHQDGRALAFGALVAPALALTVPKKEELRLKADGEFRYIGHGVPIVDQMDICTGTARFGIDIRLPGMVDAVIARPPVLGSPLVRYDDQDTLKVPGVRQTLLIKPAQAPYGFQALGGIAVIADHTWAAMAGRDRLRITWGASSNDSYDSESYKAQLLATVRKPQKVVRSVGDVEAAFAGATRIHEAEYYLPHLAHATMEPPAAVAQVKDGTAIIHAATQNPQAVQEEVAKALKIDREKVFCHVTLLGGGFGRKSKPDYAVEAALLARELNQPVRVTWTREDDIRHDYYHSVAALYLKAGTDASGRPVAWLQRCAFPPIPSLFDPAADHGSALELSLGWTDLPFAIPNLRAENGPAQAHVRIGWLRSVSNIYHAFAIQSFIDELAAAAGRDRIEYFLEVLGKPRLIDFKAEGTDYPNYGASLEQHPWDTGRLRRVVELVAEKSGWAGQKAEPGRALGFAAHRSFLSSIAVVADVRVDSRGRVSIPRVDVAVDAGRIVHPDRVRAQFEGSSTFGVSLALMGEVTARQGRIQQGNFDDYPVARISEAPTVTHVHLVPSTADPAGVGEPGVPPIAPALCNGIFAATGKRIRQLPISRSRLV